jgi:hypothetical protein
VESVWAFLLASFINCDYLKWISLKLECASCSPSLQIIHVRDLKCKCCIPSVSNVKNKKVFDFTPRFIMGYAVLQLVEALCYKLEGCAFDSRWCRWNFSLVQFFRPHYGSGVKSAFKINFYQEYFLRLKAVGA